jgi:hypothetical protein
MCVTVDGVWIGWIGFIDHLYTPLGTTSNYSAIANLHNSQFTTEPAMPFIACCVLTSHFLTTASNSEILQLPALRSFCHSCPCRTLVSLLSTDNFGILNPILCYNCHLSRCHLFSIIFAELNSPLPILNWLSQLLSAGLGFLLYSLAGGPNRRHRFLIIPLLLLACLPICCLEKTVC